MKTLVVFFILAATVAAIAECPPDPVWARTFGGSSIDYGSSVRQTTDGGYIIGGTTLFDFWLIKVDALGNEQWEHNYGVTDEDRCNSVWQTTDGGYVMTGFIRTGTGGNTDVWLLKTNAAGSQHWNSTFGGGNEERGNCVQQTADHGYIIVGYTLSYGAGDADVWLIKTGGMGNLQWSRTFGGSGVDRGNSVQQTTDRGYIITGSVGPGNVWLIKTDSTGNMQWNRTFGGAGSDQGNSVQQTTDGGYIIAGTTHGAGNNDFWLIKTDASGNQQWNRTFGGTANDLGNSVQQTSDGGYIICGSTFSYGEGIYDVWVIKTDAAGNQQWNRTIGGTNDDGGYCVRQTTDGGYIITGYTYSYGAGSCDAYLIKLEYPAPSGHVTILTFGPPDWGYRLNLDSGCLSRLVFTNFCPGTAGSLSGNAAASWTMLPNGDGNNGDSIIFNASIPLTAGSIDTFWLHHPTCDDIVNWQAGDSSGTIEGPLPVELTSFEAIAGDGQVQLQWRTESETNNDHFVLYKRTYGAEQFGALTQIPGHGTTSTPNDYQFIDRSVVNGITYEYQISDVDINGAETMYDLIVSATPSAEVAAPTEYALHQNYPNPFNSSTTIRFDIKESGQVTLKVFDLLGREVVTLVNSEVSAGAQTISWDASGLASGIYLYRIEAGDFRATRKLLFLK